MTESLDVIVSALAAGTAAGTTSTATTAMQDAYEGLKSLLRKKLHRRPEQNALSVHRADEAWWRQQLAAALAESGALDDETIARAAQAVIDQATPGRIHVDRSQGVQVGNYNEQTNHFGSPPA